MDFQKFAFTDRGWSPQFEKWPAFRARLKVRFDEELTNYGSRVRREVEALGARPARSRYSVKNIEWFALYQIGDWSSTRIEECRSSEKGDESTVLKGIKTAAELLQWKTLRSDRSPAT